MSWAVRVGLALSILLVVVGVAGGFWPWSAGSGTAPLAELRVGVLPDQSPEALQRRYAPLLGYLGERIGLPTSLVPMEGYQALLDAFAAGRVDLAWFGGATSIDARRRAGARLLVLRDVDTRFTSFFLARSEDRGRALDEFRGRRLAFGSRLSTSGHLMPRFFLERRGMSPEDDFSEVRFSGAHDATARLVQDGEVDLGALNSEVARRMFADGRLDAGRVAVVWETPPYPDYVWVVRPGLTTGLTEALFDAFLDLSTETAVGAEVLDRLGCRFFLPALEREFEPLEEVLQGEQGKQ